METTLERMKQIKDRRPTFKIMKESTKAIDTSLDALLEMRVKYRRKVALADSIKLEKADDLKNFTQFNKEIMTMKGEMDFHLKKIRYALHTILAELEIF